MSVLAVGGHDRVVGVERLHRADGNRFFTDIQVDEAADLGRAVQLGAFLLETADAQHLAQQPSA